MSPEWIDRVGGLVREVATADFGDERLRRRAMRLMQTLGAEPEKSLPRAINDGAGLEAAYRFFNNEAVTPATLLEPHILATVERAKARDEILVIHDTTTMSFKPDGHREGLGRVRSAGQAFFAHFSLALASDGTREPLGVLAMRTFVRGERTFVRGEEKAKKEQDRWGDQITEVTCRLDRARMIHVIDREADDFVLFAQLATGQHRFVIRVAHDRVLAPDETQTARKLEEALNQVKAQATREVPVSRRPRASRSPRQLEIHPAREGRVATLAFGVASVALRRPRMQLKTLPEVIHLQVVRVWEPSPPEGEAPVEWTLVTTEPVETTDDLLRVVDHYRARWTIEEYFKALKTGCSYGKRQLESLEALLNVLALYVPIAWQLLRFRAEARRTPDAPATTVLTETQIAVLRAFRRKPLPEEPTAREVMLAVAALGGHLKHNGEPGWQSLGAGYEKLMTLAQGWEAAITSQRCDQ
jgi:hypothetical protein